MFGLMQEVIRNPKEVIERLGAAEIASALQVNVRTVTNKATKQGDALPAWWFVTCRELGRKKGLSVSEEAFAFARALPDQKAS